MKTNIDLSGIIEGLLKEAERYLNHKSFEKYYKKRDRIYENNLELIESNEKLSITQQDISNLSISATLTAESLSSLKNKLLVLYDKERDLYQESFAKLEYLIKKTDKKHLKAFADNGFTKDAQKFTEFHESLKNKLHDLQKNQIASLENSKNLANEISQQAFAILEKNNTDIKSSDFEKIKPLLLQEHIDLYSSNLNLSIANSNLDENRSLQKKYFEGLLKILLSTTDTNPELKPLSIDILNEYEKMFQSFSIESSNSRKNFDCAAQGTNLELIKKYYKENSISLNIFEEIEKLKKELQDITEIPNLLKEKNSYEFKLSQDSVSKDSQNKINLAIIALDLYQTKSKNGEYFDSETIKRFISKEDYTLLYENTEKKSIILLKDRQLTSFLNLKKTLETFSEVKKQNIENYIKAEIIQSVINITSLFFKYIPKSSLQDIRPAYKVAHTVFSVLTHPFITSHYIPYFCSLESEKITNFNSKISYANAFIATMDHLDLTNTLISICGSQIPRDIHRRQEFKFIPSLTLNSFMFVNTTYGLLSGEAKLTFLNQDINTSAIEFTSYFGTVSGLSLFFESALAKPEGFFYPETRAALETIYSCGSTNLETIIGVEGLKLLSGLILSFIPGWRIAGLLSRVVGTPSTTIQTICSIAKGVFYYPSTRCTIFINKAILYCNLKKFDDAFSILESLKKINFQWFYSEEEIEKFKCAINSIKRFHENTNQILQETDFQQILSTIESAIRSFSNLTIFETAQKFLFNNIIEFLINKEKYDELKIWLLGANNQNDSKYKQYNITISDQDFKNVANSLIQYALVMEYQQVDSGKKFLNKFYTSIPEKAQNIVNNFTPYLNARTKQDLTEFENKSLEYIGSLKGDAFNANLYNLIETDSIMIMAQKGITKTAIDLSKSAEKNNLKFISIKLVEQSIISILENDLAKVRNISNFYADAKLISEWVEFFDLIKNFCLTENRLTYLSNLKRQAVSVEQKLNFKAELKSKLETLTSIYNFLENDLFKNQTSQDQEFKNCVSKFRFNLMVEHFEICFHLNEFDKILWKIRNETDNNQYSSYIFNFIDSIQLKFDFNSQRKTTKVLKEIVNNLSNEQGYSHLRNHLNLLNLKIQIYQIEPKDNFIDLLTSYKENQKPDISALNISVLCINTFIFFNSINKTFDRDYATTILRNVYSFTENVLRDPNLQDQKIKEHLSSYISDIRSIARML